MTPQGWRVKKNININSQHVWAKMGWWLLRGPVALGCSGFTCSAMKIGAIGSSLGSCSKNTVNAGGGQGPEDAHEAERSHQPCLLQTQICLALLYKIVWWVLETLRTENKSFPSPNFSYLPAFGYLRGGMGFDFWDTNYTSWNTEQPKSLLCQHPSPHLATLMGSINPVKRARRWAVFSCICVRWRTASLLWQEDSFKAKAKFTRERLPSGSSYRCSDLD